MNWVSDDRIFQLNKSVGSVMKNKNKGDSIPMTPPSQFEYCCTGTSVEPWYPVSAVYSAGLM